MKTDTGEKGNNPTKCNCLFCKIKETTAGIRPKSPTNEGRYGNRMLQDYVAFTNSLTFSFTRKKTKGRKL
jgi:hypothetical protein